METRRLNIDPTTSKARLEIVADQPVKTTIDEAKLLRKKAYLEDGITKFQAELETVNQLLDEVNEAKNVAK